MTFLETSRRSLHLFGQSTRPTAFLLDLFPFLAWVPKWIPWNSLAREAEDGRKLTETNVDRPFLFTNQAMELGTAKPCFTSYLLQQYAAEIQEDPTGEFTEAIKWTASTLVGAGDETTFSALVSGVLALMLNPDIQERAYREICEVVGKDRFPTHDDMPSMPFMDAVVKEILRWRPPVPLGLPRGCSHDGVVYAGHKICKGSIVYANIWALSRETEGSGTRDSGRFDPDRYLTNDCGNPVDPLSYIFGSGRRICPGRFQAYSTIFLGIASIVSFFEILKPHDGCDRDLEVDPIYSSGLISSPANFPCTFRARSPLRAAKLKDQSASMN